VETAHRILSCELTQGKIDDYSRAMNLDHPSRMPVEALVNRLERMSEILAGATGPRTRPEETGRNR
jgi:hypothetical protein